VLLRYDAAYRRAMVTEDPRRLRRNPQVRPAGNTFFEKWLYNRRTIAPSGSTLFVGKRPMRLGVRRCKPETWAKSIKSVPGLQTCPRPSGTDLHADMGAVSALDRVR
jgi:site-specific recombinase XerC